MTKSFFLNLTSDPQLMFFFLVAIFSCCTKSDDQPQDDLAKYGYKTNREIENLRSILHVDKLLKPISHIWKKKKVINLPKSLDLLPLPGALTLYKLILINYNSDYIDG
jgi:hypothetical protein